MSTFIRYVKGTNTALVDDIRTDIHPPLDTIVFGEGWTGTVGWITYDVVTFKATTDEHLDLDGKDVQIITLHMHLHA